MVKRFFERLASVVRANWTWVLSWAVIIAAIVLVIHFWPGPPSPVPPVVATKAGFSIIYPQGYAYDASSWNYSSSQASLTFIAKKDGYNVTFTEEKTPLEYQNDVAAYNRFIGSLKPRANFNVPLGTVSISNFVTAGDYQVVGETGILNTQGTLILAHPDTQLTDDQWRTLFESLHVN